MTNGTEQPHVDPRNALAAQRTLLAWIRTALAMMGFGFVVARFGLFLRQMAAPTVEHRPGTVSVIAGTALVLAGVATALIGTWDHGRVMRSLRAAEPLDHRTQPAVFIAMILAALGIALAGYLLVAR